MSTPITTIASQFFHAATEPLDSSAQVENYSELSDLSKVCPYKGKLVHVKNDEKIYICAGKVNGEWTWRPVMSDDGMAFFLTSSEGEVFKITAKKDGEGVGRLQVTYPAS